MSCRSNHGNSAMTSYARATSGLSDVQTLHLFHRMLNEGREREVETPTPQAINRWRGDTIIAVRGNSNITEAQRERIVQRLEALPADFVPDGPTFHAWTRIRSSAWHSRQSLNKLYQDLAARSGVDIGYLAARAEDYQRTGDASRWRPPLRFMERLEREFPDQIDLRLIPQDNRTLYALSRLLEENPAFPQVATRANPAPPTIVIPVDRATAIRVEQWPGQNTPPPEVAQTSPAPTPMPEVAEVASTQTVQPPTTPPVTPTRCQNCGQFAGAESHNCPAEVVLWLGRHQGQRLGELLLTADGRSYLNWLATMSPNVTFRRGRPDAINYSELAHTFLTGRAEIAAEQATAALSPDPVPEVAPTQTTPAPITRCQSCGQFMGEEGHTCIAEVVLRLNRPNTPDQSIGEMFLTVEGLSYLEWAASTRERGEQDVTYRDDRSVSNYSALARVFLAGRAVLSAEQTGATAPTQAVPIVTPTPPPAAPRRTRWVRAARQIRQTLSAQEQAQLRAAQEAQVQEAARPRPQATPAPSLSGPEGQATYDSWVAEIKAARVAGGGPPYETEAVLGDAATSFGVELEFKGANTDAVARKLYDLGLAGHPTMVAYHHSCPQCEGKWKVERDGSVTEVRRGVSFGGEVVAPVLQDTPEHWQQLKLVSDTIKELGGHCDENTGQHVHVSTSAYNNQGSTYRNLAMEVANNEDLLYRMSAPDQQHHRGLLRTDRPEYHYAQPIAPRVQQFLNKPSPALRTVLTAMRVFETAHDRVPWAHYMSLNMQHVNTDDASKSRVEFRTFNGTIDPVQIQTNVRLAAGLVHAAKEREVSPPQGRGIGWHRHSGSEAEDSQQIRGLIDRLKLSESGAKAMLDTFLRGRWQYQTRAELAQAS